MPDAPRAQTVPVKRVLATAGHVDHGKSTLVRALTDRDPDRLAEEKSRGLTIELGFAWTRLPGGADIAFVDVPGHQRFVSTTLAGLGPSSAVLFVVAADQGWAAQSSEHLAAIRALGIRDGLLVLTRCDLADGDRVESVRTDATARLAAAGLQVPSCVVSAVTGEGLEDLCRALVDLVDRMPAPDPAAAVRLWCDRSFTIPGAGTVVTGTLGAGTLHTADRLTLLSGDRSREVVVRGLHSEDVAHEAVGPVSRVAVNLRRTDTGETGRTPVLFTPGQYVVAQVIDVTLESVDTGLGHTGLGHTSQERATPPEEVILHVGTGARATHVRPLGGAGDRPAQRARLTVSVPLPWHVGDRAILRDPGDRRLWALQVLDVDPLPLRRRGAARERATELAGPGFPADLRVRSRAGEHPAVLARLGLPDPTDAVRVGPWWLAPEALDAWRARLTQLVRQAEEQSPLSPATGVVELARALGLPEHLRPIDSGGSLPGNLPDPAPALVRHLADAAGLAIDGGRVRSPTDARAASGLGPAEAAVASVEARLRQDPFAAPDREELAALGLGPTELAAAARAGRFVRVGADVILLPDGPARALEVLAGLDQPFTLSAARQALGTSRRVAVPLLEHLDTRGWTRRVDGQLRRLVR